MVGNTFSYDYRLGDILQFIPISGSKLYGLLSMAMGTLCLLNQSDFKSDINALRVQNNKAGNKVYPLILRFNLWHIVFRIRLF
jgi:hypothetical protein